MARAIVGLGSNEGDRLEALRRAVEALAALGEVVAVSDVFETAPVGGPPQGPYLNAAAALETALGPLELLDALLAIEAALGRVRDERWGPRPIDLDLLYYDEVVLATDRLTLPHPRVASRPFARHPAAQVGAPLEPGPAPGPVFAQGGALRERR